MSFAGVATNGPLVLAIGASAAAGLVSFLSPCVLPLVPGYLSYVTGLAGADLDSASAPSARAQRRAAATAPIGATGVAVGGAGSHNAAADAGAYALAGSGGVAVAERDDTAQTAGAGSALRVRGRILAGSLLFIGGFTTVFTATNVLAANLLGHERATEVIVGVFVVILGAAFVGWIPGMQRELRIQKLPAAGLLGAPVLGAVFALSWVPCATPTLGAVLGLSMVGGETGRAVTLTIAYCLGLGLPFLIFGLGYRRLLGVFKAIRRNSRWVTRIGGVLLIVIGIALITGGWTEFVIWLRATVGAGQVGI